MSGGILTAESLILSCDVLTFSGNQLGACRRRAPLPPTEQQRHRRGDLAQLTSQSPGVVGGRLRELLLQRVP